VWLKIENHAGGERNAHEVQNLARFNESVKAVHNLFDGCLIIPYMDVENVNVRCPELLQASLETEAH
jgi:hypothetical protein